MTRIQVVCAVTAALLLGGCVTHTATPAVQGKAYVVSGHVFGTSVYNCDASSGQPECWEVTEQETPQ